MTSLASLIAAELAAPVDAAARDGAAHLAARGRVMAILYYGSTLRAPDPDGIMDFYVLIDDARDWPTGLAIRLGQRLLPPNVGYAEFPSGGRVWRAKYAVITMAQFRARSGPRSLDTTIWARFCQPVRLVWVRDARAADQVLAMVYRCVLTAGLWAARLGPERAGALAYWANLLRRTYDAELRVEKPDRALHLLAGPLAERAGAILTLAWTDARIAWDREGADIAPRLSPRARRKAVRRWAAIRRRGRVLNVLRLLKAAFTFAGGAEYLSWKIARHTGIDLALGPFARRHPILALPMVLPRIRRAFRARRA